MLQIALDLSIPTKIRTVQGMVFTGDSLEMSWILKKRIRRICPLVRILWISNKAQKWITEQIKAEFSLEAQITSFKLSYLRHIMHRPSCLETTPMLKKWKKREE